MAASGELASSGRRNRLVTIQEMTESAGPSGRPVETWTLLTRAWMARTDVTGWEREKAETLSSRLDVRWSMPYQANMDPESVNVPKFRRLVYKGKTYDIVNAIPVGTNAEIEMTTVAKG